MRSNCHQISSTARSSFLSVVLLLSTALAQSNSLLFISIYHQPPLISNYTADWRMQRVQNYLRILLLIGISESLIIVAIIVVSKRGAKMRMGWNWIFLSLVFLNDHNHSLPPSCCDQNRLVLRVLFVKYYITSISRDNIPIINGPPFIHGGNEDCLLFFLCHTHLIVGLSSEKLHPGS